MHFIAVISSPIGNLRLESDGTAVTALFLTAEDLKSGSDLPVFRQACLWLSVYFEGRDPGPVSFPLKPQGTPFQQRVWELLRQIPYGESASYGSLAKLLGVRSAQAIGGAVGKNPIAILIPCHRVLGSKGQLTGFAYGLEIKRRLLDLEHIPYS